VAPRTEDILFILSRVGDGEVPHFYQRQLLSLAVLPGDGPQTTPSTGPPLDPHCSVSSINRDLLTRGDALRGSCDPNDRRDPVLAGHDRRPDYMRYPYVRVLIVAFTPFTLIPEKQCFEERKTSRLQSDGEASCGSYLLSSPTCLFG